MTILKQFCQEGSFALAQIKYLVQLLQEHGNESST